MNIKMISRIMSPLLTVAAIFIIVGCGATIHDAVKNNDIVTVKSLIKEGANVNNNDPNPPLCYAAQEHNLAMAKLLLDAGADVNAKGYSHGTTPLICAASNGSQEIVKLLLDAGADVNVKTEGGYTALSGAARQGYQEIVKLLLDAGADVNAKNKYGKTALYTAVERGSHTDKAEKRLKMNKTVKLLIDYGADVNTRLDNGNTPLWEASRLNHLEAVKILLEAGANAKLGSLHVGSVHVINWTKNPLELVYERLKWDLDDVEKKRYREIANLLEKYGATK